MNPKNIRFPASHQARKYCGQTVFKTFVSTLKRLTPEQTKVIVKDPFQLYLKLARFIGSYWSNLLYEMNISIRPIFDVPFCNQKLDATYYIRDFSLVLHSSSTIMDISLQEFKSYSANRVAIVGATSPMPLGTAGVAEANLLIMDFEDLTARALAVQQKVQLSMLFCLDRHSGRRADSGKSLIAFSGIIQFWKVIRH